MSHTKCFLRIKRGFNTSSLLLPLILFSTISITPLIQPASAETQINTPVIVDNGQTFQVSDDTVITLSSGQSGAGITVAQDSSNVTITADAGKVLNINVSTPNGGNGDPGGHGIYVGSSDNVLISLGETHVTATDGAAVIINGSPTKNSDTIATFGDKSSFKSDQSEAVIGSENAIINIGAEATITGNCNNRASGSLFQNNGAIVTVGNKAEISNQGGSGTTNGVAVVSWNGSNDSYAGGYLKIGDNSKIYTTGEGTGNYAVLAGNVTSTGQVPCSGDIRIGKSADIYTSGSTNTKHQGSHALVSVGEGSIITVDDFAKISTSGANSAAVRAGLSVKDSDTGAWVNTGGGTVIIGASADIFTTGSASIAVDAQYAGSKIIIGENAKITTTAGGYGVNALSQGVIEIGNNANISTNHSSAYGLNADGSGSSVTIGSCSTITTLGARVVSATNGGQVTIGANSSLGSDGGNSGHGLVASGNGSKITLGADSSVTTYASRGVYTSNGGTVDMGERTAITTLSTLADTGIGIYADGSKSTIKLGAGSSVTTAGARAVYAYNGGIVDIGESSIITALSSTGTGSHGLHSYGAGSIIKLGADSEITVAAACGAYAYNGGSANIGGGTSIATLSGNAAYGLHATGNNSSIKLGAGSSITTASADAVYASNSGFIELDGARIAGASGDKLAIIASGRSGTTGRSSAVSGDGVFDIYGNMSAEAYGSIDIIMQDGSLFKGATTYISDDSSSALNLTLNGANTEWDVTADSLLTNLYMDGGTVDMTYCDLGAKIFVVNLGESEVDNGIFRMNTDIADEFADHIYVGGLARGTYKLDVVNDGGQVTSGDELTDLVFVEADQTAVFTLDHIVELGGFQYELRGPDMDNPEETPPLDPRGIHADNAWYLRGTGRASTPGSGAINSFAGSYLMAYADMQTLIQRMGDLRQSPYGSGLWFRVHGGKFESNSKSYVRGFDMDYGGVQIGYDRKLENKWNGDIYVGAMFGYSKGDLDYHREGSGEVDSKTLGVYGTYIARNGWYIDAILKYQWMTNDFDVIDTAGTLVRGQEVETGGIGASVEIGKRIHVGNGKEDKQGWYVEPQVQLSYQHQDGGYFNATNGLRVGVDSFGSLLGRIGMLVGYETEKTNFYAKVSRVKEFDGDLTIRANGIPISESFEDNWWVYGIGCTSRINERNSLYLDIERTSGGSFSQPWRIFAGWRVEF